MSRNSNAAFAERLNKAADHSPHIPALWDGRIEYFETELLVTKQAFYKWFNGEGQPNRDNMTILAKALGVDELWLSHGVGKMTFRP